MSDKTAESLANASLAAEVTAHKATKYHWKQTSILASERHDRILTLEGEVLDKSGEAALYKERSETAEATITQQKARIEELEMLEKYANTRLAGLNMVCESLDKAEAENTRLRMQVHHLEMIITAAALAGKGE